MKKACARIVVRARIRLSTLKGVVNVPSEMPFDSGGFVKRDADIEPVPAPTALEDGSSRSTDLRGVRFPRFEGLRGWLASSVVFAHLVFLSVGASDNKITNSVYKLGAVAVFVFIILSGFVITHLLVSKRERYLPYLTRRGFRLFPAYLVCLMASLVLAPLVETTLANWHPDPSYVEGDTRLLDSPSQFFAAHLLAHLTMMHGVIPDTLLPGSSTMFLTPAWSLSLEWQFYMLAPLIVFLARGNASSVALGFVLLFTTVLYRYGVFGRFTYSSIFFSAPLYFWIGISCRLLYPRMVGAATFPLTFALGILIFLLSFGVFDNLPFAIWGAVFAVMCADERQAAGLNGRFVNAMDWLLQNRFALWLGKCSYSIYVFHSIGLIFVKYCVVSLYPEISRAGCAAALALIGVPLVLGSSYLLNRYIETPGIALGHVIARRMSRKRLKLAAALPERWVSSGLVGTEQSLSQSPRA